MKDRKCLLCGGPVEGRIDKKYCSSKCRLDHHNNISEIENNIRNVNKQLRLNRITLHKFYKTNCMLVPVEMALNLGLNLNFFTHIIDDYYFNYEYGYQLTNDNMMIEIVKNEDYLKILI